MRTGQDYIDSVRKDGRNLWIAGEKVDDITTHPATAAVVAEHAAWYDRHTDPKWRDVLTAPGNPEQAVTFMLPKSPDELRRLAEAVRAMAFLTGGNITHQASWGSTAMLGAYDPVVSFGPKDRVEAATKFYDWINSTQTFMVAPYVSPIADRFLPPNQRVIPTVVGEKDGGVIVTGAVGLGTGLPYAEYAFTAPLPGPLLPEQAIWFAFPLAAPGVSMMSRKPSARTADASQYPLSSRFDELDATVWLEEVFVPWERVFVYRDPEFANAHLDRHVTWGILRHLATAIARAEFTLGLALATADNLGTIDRPGVIESIIDLIVMTEAMRTGLTAAVLDCDISPSGAAAPRFSHLASGTFHQLAYREKTNEIGRNLAGFGGMLHPTAGDLRSPIAPLVERAYGGGTSSIEQRVALLNLVSDHTSSAMGARQAAFEQLASAGSHTWRLRTRLHFEKYQELAEGALAVLPEDVRPKLGDLSFLNDLQPLRRS